MSTDAMIILLIGFILIVVREFRRRRKKPRRNLIKEPLIKILYNPLDGKCKWMWTQFNPKTRTWEWVRDATEPEFDKFKDSVLVGTMEDNEEILKG